MNYNIHSRRRHPMRVVAISANLPEADFALLKRLAEEEGISMTDLLRRALRSEEWLREILESGATILIEEPDGRINRVMVK